MQSVAKAHDEAHVMVDDEKTKAAFSRQLGERVQQGLRLRIVHAGGWLIEQQKQRFGGERPRDLHAALVAVTEVLAKLVRLRGEAEFVQQILRALCGNRAGCTLCEGGGLDIFEDRHRVEEAYDLEGAADARKRDLAWREARERGAASRNRAARELYLAGDGIDERRLAGPVWPDEADDLAGGKRKRDMVEGAEAGEFHRHGVYRETRFRHDFSEVMGSALRPTRMTDQGFGRDSGLRHPTKLGFPALSSITAAALFGTWPSSFVP